MKKDEKTDLSAVAKLYADNLKQHGSVSKAVGWRDAESHQLRFDQLALAIEENNGPITVNDLGCGYGAFYEYLVDHGVRVGHFRGYDISDDMLTEARRRISATDVELVSSDVVDKAADYTFASGIFNVRLKQDEASWHKHVLEMLSNMDTFSTRAFAFNMLTSYVDWKEKYLCYGDPLFFFDFCKRHFSSRVLLLHDYPLWEWTIIVRK